MLKQVAQIIISYGRRYVVRTQSQQVYEASTRRKRTDYACGDWVHISILNTQQAVIEDFLPRKSLLYRQDAWKSKLIAANVSQVLFVIAASPAPNERLLQRALIAAEAADIQPVIVLNKSDLPETLGLKEKLKFYQTLGYRLVEVSALYDVQPLRAVLANQTNILLGQSGMGKSTLTNTLLGEHIARTNDISTALDAGKHTTTHAQLYDLDAQTKLIDSPGLQAFGLHHLAVFQLPQYFPDLRHLQGQCRFHDCTHRAEPNCAFKQAAEQRQIQKERLTLLQDITNELIN